MAVPASGLALSVSATGDEPAAAQTGIDASFMAHGTKANPFCLIHEPGEQCSPCPQCNSFLSALLGSAESVASAQLTPASGSLNQSFLEIPLPPPRMAP
jgi:hypothetical protein